MSLGAGLGCELLGADDAHFAVQNTLDTVFSGERIGHDGHFIYRRAVANGKSAFFLGGFNQFGSDVNDFQASTVDRLRLGLR